MKEIVLNLPELNYILVHWPENTCTPWVAAWAYRPDRDSWGQGHYFTTKENAIDYLRSLVKDKYEDIGATWIADKLNEAINKVA